jgi:hypothetical protein
MKKIILYISALLCTNIVFSQQIPTGTAGNSSDWKRGGNLVAPPGQGGSNNIFGTMWNSPIYTFTGGTGKTRLNANLTTTVNGVNKQFNGYFGISPFGFFNNNTPYAMLHLYGKNNAPGFGPGAGWRQWMETGLLMNENSDGMYVGLKQETGTNRSDAIINWSDDPSGASGPDKLRFIHTGANVGNGGTQFDPRDPFSLDGYEYMRMTAQGVNNALGYASGHIGIGPLFTNTNFPQARLHMHSEDNLTNYLQISINAVTGIAATDGTRLGVLGAQTTTNEDGNALLYNQEKRHLLFSTAHATPTDINNSFERMRITSYDAETSLPGGGYGAYVPDPSNPPTTADITRVSISHNPAQPVTRPLSLLHLGYNTGGSSLTPGATDGWRAWMNIGMFTTNSTDNVYIGLKREPATPLNPNDRNDAVVSWGDNQAPGFPTAGPDNMRFIFTATQTGSPTTSPANGFDGLESMRMTPTLNTGVFTGIGGDPTANPYFGGSLNPTNTLEINSWGILTAPGGSSGLRFTELSTFSPTVPNPGLGVLSVNSNGDVIYVDASATPTNLFANNGATVVPISGQDHVQWGQVFVGAPNGGELLHDTEIPLDDFNVFFTDPLVPDLTGNSINIGTLASNPNVRLNVYKPTFNNSNGISTIAIAGQFQANNEMTFANNNNLIGLVSRATSPTIQVQSLTGILARGNGISSIRTTGLDAAATGSSENYGIYTTAGGGTLNYALFATVATNDPITSIPPASGSYAGYFNGSVIRTGSDNFTSDANLKTGIDTLTNALDIIEQLNPKTFFYDTTNVYDISFSSKKQFGFIAQDVEQVLPEIVGSATHPASYDTLGNLITPAYTYKTLQYQSFTAILTKGIQELEAKNEKLENDLSIQDSINTALQDQINTLYSMITSCCNNNSNTENNSIQQNPTLDVTLTNNVPSIILDQNVPNPFAEQTTITYTLTEGVKKAQMLFYNIEGKLIQAVELSNASGQGQMNVFANDLSTGVYTYTLVVDGEIKGTKRMVKE